MACSSKSMPSIDVLMCNARIYSVRQAKEHVMHIVLFEEMLAGNARQHAPSSARVQLKIRTKAAGYRLGQ